MFKLNGFKLALWIAGLFIVWLIGLILWIIYDSRVRDVTSNPAFGRFDQAIVGTWRTKVPMILYEGKFEGGNSLALFHGYYGKEWRNLAEFPAGTEIQIQRLMYQQTFATSYLWVEGSVTTGDYAGRAIFLDRNFFPQDTMFHYEVYYDKPVTTPRPKWAIAPDILEK